MPIFTFGLGSWQVYRLQWKLALIQELEDQLEKPPMDLPRIIKWVPIYLDDARTRSPILIPVYQLFQSLNGEGLLFEESGITLIPF